MGQRNFQLHGWRTDMENAQKYDLVDIWLEEGVRWCDCYYDTICDEWRTSSPGGFPMCIKARHVTHWMLRPADPEWSSMEED